MFQSKKIKPTAFIPAIFFLLSVILFLILIIHVSSYPYMSKNITDISDKWQYHTDLDPEPKPVCLPSGTKGIYLNENWYLSHTLEDRGKDAAIMFRSDYLKIIAQLDGEEIYRYGYDQSSIASPGKKLAIITLPDDYVGKKLTLTLTPTMNLRAYRIYIGNVASLMAYAIGKSIPVFAAAIFVFLLGTTLLFAFLTHRKEEDEASSADLWFGIFVILVGLFIPGKSFLLLILLNPSQAAFLIMLVNFFIPCAVLLFAYSSCKRFKIPIIIALCIHIAGFLPTALMQLFMNDPPTEILAVFVYLIAVYYILTITAFIIEIHHGKKKYERLKWAGFILIIMTLAGRLNSMFGNPLHLSDIEMFSKIGLIVFITIEVIGRINSYFKKNAQILADLQASQIKSRLALEHFDDIRQYTEEAHALNHDIHHHFSALNHLMDQGNLTRAKEYLSQLTKNYPVSKQIIYTNNHLLNYIMGYVVRESEKNNIDFTYTINLPENIKMSDSDFYSLFINITGNAIEACTAMVNMDNRNIEFACNMKNGFMHVMCKNSKENTVVKENDKYISTKTDYMKRGLGLGIVQRVVEKYNGVLDIEYDKNWFMIKLALKA